MLAMLRMHIGCNVHAQTVLDLLQLHRVCAFHAPAPRWACGQMQLNQIY